MTFRITNLFFILVRYVAAYLLAVLGGNEAPSAADLQKILSSVGIEVDAARVTKIIGELKGKSIDELIAQGREKLSSMPAGGAAAAAPAAGKLMTNLSLNHNSNHIVSL